MHESVLASSILRTALEAAQNSGEEYKNMRISSITVQVDVLSCCEATTLQGAFAIIAEGSRADGARLNIKTVPLLGFCQSCQQGVSTTSAHDFACPKCGKANVNWENGGRMIISSINVEA